QPAEALDPVEEVLKPENTDSATLYDAACFYALIAARAAKQAPKNTSSVRAEKYAMRAVALLRQAVQKGWKDFTHLKNDPDLNPLRSRADFQKLLQDLEAMSK